MKNLMMRPAKLLTRLSLSVSVCFVATGGYAQQAAQRQAPPLKVMPLRGGVYWTSGGAGGNTGFIIGSNGVIVIDAKTTADSARAVLAEIAKATSKPVTHVILTHSDADHVNGLAGFPKGLTIIAHENCKSEMLDALADAPPAMAPLRDYLPTQTVANTEDLTIDGVRLRLLHLAPGHTSGDLMVYLPEQKILFAGDILTMQFPYPLIHREKHGSTEGWITNMDGMLAVDADTFVPGHGELQARAALEKKLADTEARRADVIKLFAEGKNLNQVKQVYGESTAPQGRGGFATFTEVVYREKSASQPFDAHDLSGVWYIRGIGFSMSRNVPRMTPSAQVKWAAAKPGLGPRGKPLGNDPIMGCDPMGLVRSIVWGVYPTEIIQTPKETFMLFDWFYTRRQIWTDGRKLPSDPEPRFYAYSIGRWEGDTFVVESNGFDDRVWVDADGHPISTDGKLEERYRRVDHDTLELRMTLTDPKSYTEPWVSERLTANLVTPGLDPATEMREDVCVPSAEAKYKEEIREPAGEKK
jgi:glyoxylase-like metal-dependent hydrolase (beta-lactamase superfamily II)